MRFREPQVNNKGINCQTSYHQTFWSSSSESSSSLSLLFPYWPP